MDDIEGRIKEWDDRIRAAPTFEELRDVEFVRRSGRINMLVQDVQRELYDRGRYAGVRWLQRCKEHRQPWHSFWDSYMKFFESRHGPKESWFTSELLDEWESDELALEELELRRRLAEIRSKRSAKPTHP